MGRPGKSEYHFSNGFIGLNNFQVGKNEQFFIV